MDYKTAMQAIIEGLPMRKPKWLPALQACRRASLKAFQEKGSSVFTLQEFQLAGRTPTGRAMSRVWLSRLCELKLASEAWGIESTGAVEYMLTEFGMEVLSL